MGSNNEALEPTRLQSWLDKLRAHPIGAAAILIALVIAGVAGTVKDVDTILTFFTGKTKESGSSQSGPVVIVQRDIPSPPAPAAPKPMEKEPDTKPPSAATPVPEQVAAPAPNQKLLSCSPQAETFRKMGASESQITMAIHTRATLSNSLVDAAQNGNVVCIKALLEAGEPPNGDNNISHIGTQNLTPLIAAALAGNTETVRLLLDGGAMPDFKGLRGHQPDAVGVPPIVATTSSEVVRLLIDRGADVKPAAPRGLTALHSAAQKGDLALAILLVEKGADRNAKYEIIGVPPRTPLDWAKQNKHTAVVQFLSKK